MKADILIKNGIVLTMDKDNTIHDNGAVASRGGKTEKAGAVGEVHGC